MNQVQPTHPTLAVRPNGEPDLAAIVPIAVVIAAGCEPCAERMVRRALDRGTSPQRVRKVLGIVAQLQKEECFAAAVGEQAVRRMDAPLARGRKTLETHTVVEQVKQRYGDIAVGRSSGCGCGTGPAADPEQAPKLARELGYSAADLEQAGSEANLGLGCGAPIGHLNLQPGETVLDLGSGGGLDAGLAASKVGPQGKVIGIDMTPEMLERARDYARRAGLDQVEFREGRLEDLPVPDASVNAVTSNCVINLVPDKQRVFEEVARVLKPGGRLVISDIVLGGRLPEPIERSVLAWVGCVAGALPREEYFGLVERAGLRNLEVLKEVDLSTLADGFLPESTDDLLEQAGVTLDDLRGKIFSVTFRAEKA